MCSGDIRGVSRGEIYDFTNHGYIHIFDAHFSPTLSLFHLFIAKLSLGRVSRGFRGFQVGFKCLMMDKSCIFSDMYEVFNVYKICIANFGPN